MKRPVGFTSVATAGKKASQPAAPLSSCHRRHDQIKIGEEVFFFHADIDPGGKDPAEDPAIDHESVLEIQKQRRHFDDLSQICQEEKQLSACDPSDNGTIKDPPDHIRGKTSLFCPVQGQ